MTLQSVSHPHLRSQDLLHGAPSSNSCLLLPVIQPCCMPPPQRHKSIMIIFLRYDGVQLYFVGEEGGEYM